MSDKNEEKKDFVIKDRRFAHQTEDAPSEEKAKRAKQAADAAEKAEEPPPAGSAPRESQEYQLPKIDFATFIFSLNSSVFVQLGLLEDPATGQKEKNLPMAKQTIDILGMLEEKTRGNLTKEEENMLKNILYDLRILYVKEKG